MIAILLVGIFLISCFLGMPLAFSFGISAAITCIVGDIPLQIIAQRLVTGIDSFALVAVPGFVLVGQIMTQGGVARRIVDFSNALVRHFKGGLAMASIFSGMIIGGISGSAVADTAALGGILIPTMEEENYPREFSSAVIAASGSIGIIIPPSIPMIVYSMTSNLSLLNLFLAGYIPGVCIGLSMMYICHLISGKKAYGHLSTHFSWRNIVIAFWGSLLAIITPVIIIGGILSGIFTATESSMIGVVYSVIISIYAYKELRWGEMLGVLLESVKTTARVTFILASASVFSYIFINEGVPELFLKLLFTISSNKIVILILANLIFLFIGCIIDPLAAIIIFVPVLLPLGEALNMDQIHLALIFIVNMSIGLLTPPVGYSIFVSSTIAGVPIERTALRAIPIMIAMVSLLLIINIFPQFVLFVPNLFR